MLKKLMLFLLLALIVIQFIHPKKNRSEGPQPNYIGNVHAIPDDLKPILAKACNDCHTNNTIYPWYSKIQPVDWWMDNHIKDGKKEFNLDEYANKSLRYQYKKMEEVIDQVKEGEMPLNSYTWIHKDAILSDAEKNKLVDWAGEIMKKMEAQYPIDSLKRPKK